MDPQSQYEQPSQVATASNINILAGLWLLVSIFLYYNSAAGTREVVNDAVVGCLIALFASIRNAGESASPWPTWISLALGLWLVASPWVLGYATIPSHLWNSTIVGLVVTAMAGWSLTTRSSPPIMPPRAV